MKDKMKTLKGTGKKDIFLKTKTKNHIRLTTNYSRVGTDGKNIGRKYLQGVDRKELST